MALGPDCARVPSARWTDPVHELADCWTCRWLLAATTIMGLVCGIAYSASYQMVSRFAKKNTISLGLGCVGSGIIVLFLEVGLQVGIHPSKLQSILLYELTSGALGNRWPHLRALPPRCLCCRASWHDLAAARILHADLTVQAASVHWHTTLPEISGQIWPQPPGPSHQGFTVPVILYFCEHSTGAACSIFFLGVWPARKSSVSCHVSLSVNRQGSQRVDQRCGAWLHSVPLPDQKLALRLNVSLLAGSLCVAGVCCRNLPPAAALASH